MRDFTKFRLKSEQELAELLSGKDNLHILACNKCFKAFTADSMAEPEADELLELANRLGKTVLSVSRLDFLCNEHRLRAKAAKAVCGVVPNSKPPVLIVISCGVGTQTVAGVVEELSLNIPVYTACDSLETGGGHGMSLSDVLCNACGQCFLNSTNGICPVTGCPKTLLNGPCGGAKDGKCEVDSDAECVWEKICDAVPSNSIDGNCVNSFDFNRFKHSEEHALSLSAQKRRQESFHGGIYLKYNKGSTDFLTLEVLPFLPSKVVIPMSQHAGMSADPIVCVGDRVTVGQKIGEAVGTLSSSVHASISGFVSEIALRSHPNTKQEVMCVTIDSDGKGELHKSVKPIPYWEELDILDIDAIIAEKGIVGMGGAGFPTPVKLKSPKPIDTILLNGCESEPYITADHRIMLEKADDIIKGLQIMMKCTGAERGIIVISDNKSDAIMHLEAKTAAFDDIFVMALWSKYPQGAERMLIARALGRQLAYGQRPYDVGAIVINISTARAIGDAFTRGMPLIERAVTVSGPNIRAHGNYMIPIGTLVSDILDYCGLMPVSNCNHVTVKLGGPMMGATLDNYDVPIIKGSNALIAFVEPLICTSDCIRCGRCVEVCPMELLPLYFPVFATDDTLLKNGKTAIGVQLNESNEETNPLNCIECGACDYICPSGIKIRDAIRLCKESYVDN